MSDIIPFPQSKNKLIRDIKRAYQQEDYEEMYQLVETYEAQFEMDEQLSLMKCSMLYQLGYYLELREEVIILLQQGHRNYDELIIYYAKSLNGLGQYYETVQVIDQVIDEVNNHRTRMELLPIKDYAQGKLEQTHQAAVQSLEQFDQLSNEQQVHAVLNLLDSGQFQYHSTMVHLIQSIDLAPNVLSLMLEYLQKAQCNDTIKIEKLGYTVDIVPSELPDIEHYSLQTKIAPMVLKELGDALGALQDPITDVFAIHAIHLYPLDLEEMAPLTVWIEAYENYFKTMIGLESLDESNEIIPVIQQVDSQLSDLNKGI